MSRIPAFLEQFAYGRAPVKLPEMKKELLEEGVREDGVRRRQLRLTFTHGSRSWSFALLIFIPKGEGPHPVLVSGNLNGNHSISDDDKVFISSVHLDSYFRSGMPKYSKKRNTKENRLPALSLCARGYAVATFFYEEAEPDARASKKRGIRSLYPELIDSKEGWGTLRAWSWCVSRVIDALQDESGIDSSRIAVYGLSRMGKASLLAAAEDERIKAVIADGSGRMGAALTNSTGGELLWFMRLRWPQWLSKAFSRSSVLQEGDQDALLAAIAPRSLVVSAGARDWWTDPRSQRKAVDRATSTFLAQDAKIDFFLRSNGHEPSDDDWEKYIGFLSKIF